MKMAATAGIELRSIDGHETQIALRGVRVRAHLTGMSQKTIVEQTFINRENRAIEAVYTFPLPEDAAVCGFEVITGDRVLTGTIEENDRAIEKYDEAISQGHGAYMLEADRPDVFTAHAGNLKPGQVATIRLTYVAPLARVDKQIRVTFPTTVAPRYAGTAGMDPMEGMIDAHALNPPKALHVPYGLTLEVDVDLGRKIRQITSPTHTISVSENQNQDSTASYHRVQLERAVTAMDRDIVLCIELAREHAPCAQVSRGIDGAPFVAVSFVPEFELNELADPPASENVFVLDCSGSMQGNSIEQAVAALGLCLRSLSPGDTFNIYRFGSSFERFRSESVIYSSESLKAALEYINRGADLGGTEIMAPLEAIFATSPREHRYRNIILLTDGEVTNEPAVIAAARKHRDHNRIFSFGIGSASSAFLVKGLARATRGAAEFISGDERIEDKVLRLFSRIASPAVEDVSIDWNGADVQTLAEIPPVFDGDLLTVFGRVQGSPPPDVTLRCRLGGKEKSWTVALPPTHQDDGVISTMWARRTIQSLEEVNDIRRLSRPKEKDSPERRMIIDLSRQFNLVSGLTTMIAIEHRSLEERNAGQPALRRVPVMLAHGWGEQHRGGVVMACLSAGSGAGMTLDRAMTAIPVAPAPAAAHVAHPAGGGFLRRMFSRKSFGAGETFDRLRDSKVEFKSAPSVSPFQQLLSKQSADGWFEWDEKLIASIVADWKTWQATIERMLPALTTATIPHKERLVHTALILLILDRKFPGEASAWRRGAQKAQRWIAQQANVLFDQLEQWLKKALVEMGESAR